MHDRDDAVTVLEESSDEMLLTDDEEAGADDIHAQDFVQILISDAVDLGFNGPPPEGPQPGTHPEVDEVVPEDVPEKPSECTAKSTEYSIFHTR